MRGMSRILVLSVLAVFVTPSFSSGENGTAVEPEELGIPLVSLRTEERGPVYAGPPFSTAQDTASFPLILAAASGQRASGERTGSYWRSSVKRNFFTVLLGAAYWQNLSDIEPSPPVAYSERFGRFEEWVFNLEGSYHRLVTTWFGRDLRIGLDLGFFYHENKEEYEATVLPSGETFDGELVARGFYLTPSVRWIFGESGSPRVSLGAGLGYYQVEFVETLSDGLDVDEYYDEGALGGYLSLGVEIPLISRNPERLALRFEAKVHYAEFGDLDHFAPGSDDLKGPFYLFQVGLTF